MNALHQFPTREKLQSDKWYSLIEHLNLVLGEIWIDFASMQAPLIVKSDILNTSCNMKGHVQCQWLQSPLCPRKMAN